MLGFYSIILMLSVKNVNKREAKAKPIINNLEVLIDVCCRLRACQCERDAHDDD